MNHKLKSIFKRTYFILGNIINIPTFYCHGVKIPDGIECVGKIRIRNKGKLTIGRNVRIRSGIWTNPIGRGSHTNIIVYKDAELIIGNHVKMSNTSICCTNSILIDDEVMIGGGVCIWDTDFHSLNPYIRMELIDIAEKPKTVPIHIENGCFIGAGSIILKGSHIGQYSVIGAGSIVNGNVPPFEVWAGNPATFRRKLNELELSSKI